MRKAKNSNSQTGAQHAAKKDDEVQQEEPTQELPLFYKNPVPLQAERHAKAGLRPHDGYGYARGTNASVLNAPEFALAARHYPIVFSSGTPTTPFAIVGFRDDENLFIEPDDSWHEGAYIPAYVRRYPFVGVKESQSQRLILCVDEASDRFEAQSGSPFFDAQDKPSAETQEMLKFCETFQTHQEDTLKFTEWLDQNDLLEDRFAQGTLEDGETFTLRGFRLISTEKMQVLGDETILQLHKRGWLSLMHFHLQSLNNWGVLGRLARRYSSKAAA